MADFEKVYQIKFDTRQAERAIAKLEKGLGSMEKSMVKIGRRFQGAASKLNKVGNSASKAARGVDKIDRSAKKANRSIKNIGRSMQKVGRGMRSLGRTMTLSLSAPIALLGGGAIKMAADYEEALDKVNVVFGKSAKTVTDFTDNALKQFGLGKKSAIEMTSLFGDMAVGMKIPQQEAANLSIEIAKLAADTASLKNVPLAEIQTAFAGIFTGETESMKRIGVMLQQKNIQDWMNAKGIKKQFKEMKTAEQVMMRFRFVQDFLGKAVGNFELTAASAANRTRTFQESISDLGIVFGREMLPAFVKVIDKLSEFVNWFGKLDEGTKETIIIVAGLVAVLGPLTFALGGVITVLAGIKIALVALIPFIAANPVVLILAGIAAAAVATAANYDLLVNTLEGMINETVISFKRLSLSIRETMANAIRWSLNLYNKAAKFIGLNPINVESIMGSEDVMGVKKTRREIAALEEVGFDIAGERAAAKARDKARVGDFVKKFTPSFDLPEARGASKSKTAKARPRGGSNARALQAQASASVDRKLDLLRSQSGGGSGAGGGVVVNVNAPINAPGGNPVKIRKELERQIGKSLDKATMNLAPTSQ